MSTAIKLAIARAIAAATGDDFDAIPRDKTHWTAERGMFGGRARDINEPTQGDYLAMALAALRALAAQQPSAGMVDATHGTEDIDYLNEVAMPNYWATWSAMLAELVKESRNV